MLSVTSSVCLTDRWLASQQASQYLSGGTGRGIPRGIASPVAPGPVSTRMGDRQRVYHLTI